MPLEKGVAVTEVLQSVGHKLSAPLHSGTSTTSRQIVMYVCFILVQAGIWVKTLRPDSCNIPHYFRCTSNVSLGLYEALSQQEIMCLDG